MIKAGDIVELEIEKLLYQGSSLARYYSDETPSGFSVFVFGGAVEDKLKVKILKVNKSYATGEIVEIVKPSKYRKKPFCPLFNACGGCFYQYLDYDFLVEQKNNMLKESFSKLDYDVEILNPIKSPNKEGYRRKIQYRVSQTKNSKRLLVGYYKEKSHDIVNIKYCPIQPKIADDLAQFLRDNWALGAYVEKTHKGLLRAFILRLSSDLKSVLITLVLNSNLEDYLKIENDVLDFAQKITSKFQVVKGVNVNLNPNKTNLIFSCDFKNVLGDEYIVENLKSQDGTVKSYKISPESFFQVNPDCASLIFDEAKKYIDDNSTILDAYGGVGTIGIYLSDKARKIYLVEENESATKNAKENFKLNNCKNYEVFLGDAKECFRKFLKEKKTFDTVILDPPRAGCDKEALDLISKMCNKIIYISCNPQTLVRDLNYLFELNFKAKQTRMADMFPYSYHLESITLVEKVLDV